MVCRIIEIIGVLGVRDNSEKVVGDEKSSTGNTGSNRSATTTVTADDGAVAIARPNKGQARRRSKG
jgi:hypothetical protein